jgi:hypothetical protein
MEMRVQGCGGYAILLADTVIQAVRENTNKIRILIHQEDVGQTLPVAGMRGWNNLDVWV